MEVMLGFQDGNLDPKRSLQPGKYRHLPCKKQHPLSPGQSRHLQLEMFSKLPGWRILHVPIAALKDFLRRDQFDLKGNLQMIQMQKGRSFCLEEVGAFDLDVRLRVTEVIRVRRGSRDQKNQTWISVHASVGVHYQTLHRRQLKVFLVMLMNASKTRYLPLWTRRIHSTQKADLHNFGRLVFVN